MKKLLIILFLSIITFPLFPQVVVTIEGTVVTNSETGVWLGINVPRRVPAIFTFRNNSITSVNSNGYMLQAGDKGPAESNNNLDGSIFTGNKFTWNGTDLTSVTHALFTGYNKNVIIKYNYLSKTPNGIQRKSNGMNNTSGGIAYNIIVNPNVGIVVKGINDVKILNNTFYQEKTITQNQRGLIDIQTNSDNGLNALSTGTKNFNNIFYTEYQTPNIKIDERTSLTGLESDYNLYWCVRGVPVFNIAGHTYTFAQWQELGYDLHSIVIDPHFINFTDFVPAERLNYGVNLGAEWQTGLPVNAIWGTSDPQTADQNGTWQVGARIHEGNNNSQEVRKVFIYPNPANNFLNIAGRDSSLLPQLIKITDLAGNVEFESSIVQSFKNILVQLYNY